MSLTDRVRNLDQPVHPGFVGGDKPSPAAGIPAEISLEEWNRREALSSREAGVQGGDVVEGAGGDSSDEPPARTSQEIYKLAISLLNAKKVTTHGTTIRVSLEEFHSLLADNKFIRSGGGLTKLLDRGKLLLVFNNLPRVFFTLGE